MSNTSNTPSEEDKPPPLTNDELTEEIYASRALLAGQDKKLASLPFDLKSFTRRQDARTKMMEDSLALLIEATQGNRFSSPHPGATGPISKRWRIPPSLTEQPPEMETEQVPRVKPEAPRFNGVHAQDWIRKIQRYYNHHYTPLEDRLYLTSYLYDYFASSWLTYWEDNYKHKSWDEFLVAVKQRFDPDLYADHVDCLAALQQTTSLAAYQTEFEDIM